MNATRPVTEVVPAALAGERLDRVVSLLVGCSRSDAAALVAAGGAALDGVVASAGRQRVAEGQLLAVDLATLPRPTLPRPDPDVEVTVVHEDPDVVVVDKPAGLVVHPGAGHAEGTLVSGLLARYPELASVGERERPGIVHRLDRETSGLLVVARTPLAYERLVATLAARTVTRRYVALVWGVPDPPAGVIEAPVGRSPRQPTRQAVVVGGREARTGYEIRRAFSEPVECALLGCQLETGRTHQIRVHFAAVGHPVVGDKDYRGDRPGLRPPRLFLHCEHLQFTHPRTDEPLSFDAPLPPDLAGVLARLR